MIENMADGATFIAGSPRSGTTLMTALLDGHPSLLVFPEEYLYLQPFRMPGQGSQSVLEEVFKKKVLLRLQGRKNFLDQLHEESRNYDAFNYSQFEEAVNECFRLLIQQKSKAAGGSVVVLALIAVMCGFARAIGKETCSRWVIKHPHYELHWQQLFNDFPTAKMIYMVRDPRDAILSRTIKRSKKRHLKGGSTGAAWKSGKIRLRPSLRFLEEWKQSVTTYLLINESLSGKILGVHYEALVSSPRNVMKRVSKFLGEPWHESLVSPSFAGAPWNGTSMQELTFYGVSAGEGRKNHEFPPHRLWQIDAWLVDAMVRNHIDYAPSDHLERVDVKALASWLQGEGVWDFFRNRLRMLGNRRKLLSSGIKQNAV